MKRYNSRFDSISGAFTFLLFGLFVVLSCLLVLFSLYAYQHTLNRTSDLNRQRILQSYIRNAVRAEDSTNSISVQDRGGMPVLAISETEEDETYLKYIYSDGSVLRELYLSEEDPFDPSLGEEICEVSSFDVRLSGRLLTISAAGTDGEQTQVSIALYAGK